MLAALLVGLALADAYDIHVKLYRDENCFEEAQELKFTTDNCYANFYTNRSIGFMVDILSLTEPARVALVEFEDHCHNSINMKPLYAQQCEPFLGELYGMYSIVPRELCYGQGTCNSLNVAEMNFYEQVDCTGPPSHIFPFPVETLPRDYQKTFGSVVTVGMDGYIRPNEIGFDQPAGGRGSSSGMQFRGDAHQSTAFFPVPTRTPASMCIRTRNGTALYMRTPNASQIHEFAFDLSEDCTPLDGTWYSWYAYTLGHCYAMQDGRAYRWQVYIGGADSVAWAAPLVAMAALLS